MAVAWSSDEEPFNLVLELLNLGLELAGLVGGDAVKETARQKDCPINSLTYASQLTRTQ